MRTIRKAAKIVADIIAAVSILGMVLIGIALADGARREDFRIGGRDV
jgi:hypothetical protein